MLQNFIYNFNLRGMVILAVSKKKQSTTAHALIKLYKNPTALQKSSVPVFKTLKFSAGKIS